MHITKTTSGWGAAAALAALALTLAGAGCGPKADAPNVEIAEAAKSASFTLGCTIPTLNHPFFVAMKKGLDEQANDEHAILKFVDGKNDAQAQLTAIDGWVVEKVHGIVLCPTETETLGPGVLKANGANIPVIIVNRTVAEGKVVTYVGADDREGGRMQGEALMKALPKGGKIVLLQGILGSSPQRDREAGLEDALKGHPEYRIVQKEPYKFERNLGVTAMEGILTKYAKGAIDAVVAQSDDGALAAADVCTQKGRSEITIIGFNGESDAFEQIRAGKMHATILQDAETQGREAIKAAVAHLRGEKVKNPQITPLYTITKENIDQHKPAWESSSS